VVGRVRPYGGVAVLGWSLPNTATGPRVNRRRDYWADVGSAEGRFASSSAICASRSA